MKRSLITIGGLCLMTIKNQKNGDQNQKGKSISVCNSYDYYEIEPTMRMMVSQIMNLIHKVKELAGEQPLNYELWMKLSDQYGPFWKEFGFEMKNKRKLMFDNIQMYRKVFGENNIERSFGIPINAYPTNPNTPAEIDPPDEASTNLKLGTHVLMYPDIVTESIIVHEVHHIIDKTQVIPYKNGKKGMYEELLYWCTPGEVQGNAKQAAFMLSKRHPELLGQNFRGQDLLDVMTLAYKDTMYEYIPTKMYALYFDDKRLEAFLKRMRNDKFKYPSLWIARCKRDMEEAFNYFSQMYKDLG